PLVTHKAHERSGMPIEVIYFMLKESIKPFSIARQETIGQSYNFTSNAYSKYHTKFTKISTLFVLELLNKLIGQCLHQLAIVRTDGLRRKEACSLLALQLVRFAFLVQNRGLHLTGQTRQ